MNMPTTATTGWRAARRAFAIGAVVVGALVGLPTVAQAHPLGNFTLNRYSGVVVSTDAVTVDHVLDIAEIPTAQRSPAIDTDRDGTMSPAELAPWATSTCADATQTLRLTVEGSTTRLSVTAATARTLKGQAGLPTLRVECSLTAALPAGAADAAASTDLRLVDTGVGDEVGWREMTARGDGTTLRGSSVPTRSRSARLTTYPKDLLTSPLDVREARFSFTPGGPRLEAADAAAQDAPTAVTTDLTRGADRLTLAFEGLIGRAGDSPLTAILALLAALVLGASHAVAPGHGKTIMAFYLSGRREGALRSAMTVGATVTATHTAGVLALGLLVSAGTAFVPARVYPWLSVVSGLLVVLVGMALLRESARARAARAATVPHQATTPDQHTATPDQHTGDHAEMGILPDPAVHSHGLFGRPHSHAPLAQPIPAAAHAHATANAHAAPQNSPRDHARSGILVDAPGHPHDHDTDLHNHDAHPHPHPHPHRHDAHDGHSHDHDVHEPHGHDHADPYAVDEPAPVSRRGLIAIGMAGGLLPSPSALLVLLGAVALGHAWFGVALVVAFGVGMAATLAVVGLLVMRLREKAEVRLRSHPASRFAPLLRAAPIVTAVVVIGLGAVLAWRGFSATGVV